MTVTPNSPREEASQAPELSRARRLRLGVECVLVFGLVPVMQAMGWLPVPLLALLFAAAVVCGAMLRRDKLFRWPAMWRARASVGEWRRVLITFAAAVPVLAGLLYWLRPESLFAFPGQRPGAWLLVVVLYPLVSVFPQEIIYRAFFLHRYRGLFGEGRWMVVASALAFGFAHISFHNWVAVALTVPGGILFARTWRRTDALLFVSFEHALYGACVFTVGLGDFLLEGTMRLIR